MHERFSSRSHCPMRVAFDPANSARRDLGGTTATRVDHSAVGDRATRAAHLGLRGRQRRGACASRQPPRVRSAGGPDGIGGRHSFAAGRRHRGTPRQRGRPVEWLRPRRPRADRGGVHPLQADAALHPGLDGAGRPGGAGAAARRGASDHRPDGGRVCRDAGGDTGGCRAASHTSTGAAALGSARRGIRLLDLESRTVDGRCPLHGGRAAGSRARSPQSETGGACRSHSARRDRAHRQAALDRRCADPYRCGVVGALRGRSVAIARGPTARCDR